MSYFSSQHQSVVKSKFRKEANSGYLKIIKKNLNKKAKNACDLGCSIGDFIEEINNEFEGINSIGVDNDRESIKIAKKKVNIKFYQKSINSFIKESITKKNKFDIITSLNVLEHLSKKDINYFFKNINKLMNKGAVLLIKVPNAGTIYNNPWLYNDITHQTLLTKKSLKQILLENNFNEKNIQIIEDKLIIRGKMKLIRIIIFNFMKILDVIVTGNKFNNSIQTPTLLLIIKK